MPVVNAETPTQKQKIAFCPFMVPKPYAEGHTIDAEEAEALNTAYGARFANLVQDDIRAKFAGEKSKGDGKDVEWQEGWSLARAQEDIVNSFIPEFSWTSERPKRDPVEAEMHRLATLFVDRELAKLNVKLDAADRRTKIRFVLEKNEKVLRKTAEKNINTTLDIDLGLGDQQAA